jgi:AcrR family transcriptional regulator
LSTRFSNGTVLAVRKPREEARRARNLVYRRHILEAAEQVFAARGFEAAKLQEISARSGLSMGTIYSIFPGKNDLFEALVQMRGQELVEVARRVAARRLPPREALLALGEAYVDYFVAHPDFLRMQVGASASWALGPGNAPTRMQFWRQIHELQAGIFRDGVASGVFVEDDPTFLAKLFSALDEVLLAEWVAGGMTVARAALVARLQALVTRMFCRGSAS